MIKWYVKKFAKLAICEMSTVVRVVESLERHGPRWVRKFKGLVSFIYEGGGRGDKLTHKALKGILLDLYLLTNTNTSVTSLPYIYHIIINKNYYNSTNCPILLE